MTETKETPYNNPTQCRYWHEPKHIKSDPLQDRFELLKTYIKIDQFWQYLLKCRECGQLYFMEFRENTDWVQGNDPQFTVYIPVPNETESDRVQTNGCRNFIPRLHKDFPSEAETPMLYWVASV